MHEVAIVDSLIHIAEQEISRAGAKGRVLGLKLSIGRLSCASPEAVRFAFELLAVGTGLEGAELHIERPMAVCHCRQCGQRTETDEVFGACPVCGGRDVSIEGGQDLLLQSIEIEEMA